MLNLKKSYTLYLTSKQAWLLAPSKQAQMVAWDGKDLGGLLASLSLKGDGLSLRLILGLDLVYYVAIPATSADIAHLAQAHFPEPIVAKNLATNNLPDNVIELMLLPSRYAYIMDSFLVNNPKVELVLEPVASYLYHANGTQGVATEPLSLLTPENLHKHSIELKKSLSQDIQVKPSHHTRYYLAVIPVAILIITFIAFKFLPTLQPQPASPLPTTTASQEQTATPNPTVVPIPAEYRVSILNGSGKAGLAQSTSETLRDNGFDEVEIGNTSESTSSSVTTRSHLPGSIKDIIFQALVDYEPKLIIDPALDPNYDIIIIIGAE